MSTEPELQPSEDESPNGDKTLMLPNGDKTSDQDQNQSKDTDRYQDPVLEAERELPAEPAGSSNEIDDSRTPHGEGCLCAPCRSAKWNAERGLGSSHDPNG